MNTSLPPELKRFIDKKLKEGHYLSADELVVDALRAIKSGITFILNTEPIYSSKPENWRMQIIPTLVIPAWAAIYRLWHFSS